LIGVYLHGSLAMGCFNPERSDIDLLVIIQHRLTLEQKKTLVESLLRISGAPHPIEISFLRISDINPWRYPTPYNLHYSEDWRMKYERVFGDGEWGQLSKEPQTDRDLAAHIAVTRQRGFCLWGEPIQLIFPEVPEEHFIDSITSDLNWSLDKLDEIPVYAVLNACRILAYLQRKVLFSKREGALWALEDGPVEFRPMINTALEAYRSSTEKHPLLDLETAHDFLVKVSDKISAMD